MLSILYPLFKKTVDSLFYPAMKLGMKKYIKIFTDYQIVTNVPVKIVAYFFGWNNTYHLPLSSI